MLAAPMALSSRKSLIVRKAALLFVSSSLVFQASAASSHLLKHFAFSCAEFLEPHAHAIVSCVFTPDSSSLSHDLISCAVCRIARELQRSQAVAGASLAAPAYLGSLSQEGFSSPPRAQHETRTPSRAPPPQDLAV